MDALTAGLKDFIFTGMILLPTAVHCERWVFYTALGALAALEVVGRVIMAKWE